MASHKMNMPCQKTSGHTGSYVRVSTFDGICIYDGRVIIPQSLRREVLDCLHSAHHGVAGMKARAARSVFWPGLSAAISSRRAQCRSCHMCTASHHPSLLNPCNRRRHQHILLNVLSLTISTCRDTSTWLTQTDILAG